MRILVVEDEKKVARFIQQGLEEEHYIVDVVHDGSQGYAMAVTEKYDAIVLDVMLPGKDGIAFTRELREQTAETMEDAMEQARDKTEQITHDVRKQAGKLEQRGQTMFDEQKNHLATAVEAGKDAVQGK